MAALAASVFHAVPLPRRYFCVVVLAPRIYYLQVYTVYRHIASFVDCESRIVATQPRLGSGLEGHIEITVE
jgi:hypothetical protein